MKRRVIIAIAVASMLSLTACHRIGKADMEVSIESIVDDVAITDEVAETEPVVEDEDDSVIAIVDAVGYIHQDSEVTLYELKDDEIIGAYTIPAKYVRLSYFVEGNYIYCSVYEESESQNVSDREWSYRAYNYKTGSEFFLSKEPGGAIAVKNGQVVVTSYNYDSEEYTERHFDVKTFREFPESVQKWIIPKDCYIVWNDEPDGTLRAPTISAELARNGHIMLYKYVGDWNDRHKKYFFFDGAWLKEVDEIDEVGRNIEIFYYDDKNIVYQVTDDYWHRKLINLDIETGEKSVIKDGLDVLLGTTEDGIVYFTEKVYKTDSVYDETIYSYDVANDRLNTLYFAAFKPGTGGDKPIKCISVKNGMVYARYNDGRVGDWCVLKDGEFKRLNINPKVYKVNEFGTVKCLEENVRCEFCDASLGEFVGEYIELNDTLSNKAQAITELIKEDTQNECDSILAEGELQLVKKAEDCEGYGHDFYTCEVTYEEFITGIRILGRYMAIDKEGYWYGGGAHGMESMEGFLYNLDTGKKTAFSEVFPGSEKDFKTIVAEKTKEDFLSEDSYNGYDWDDEDSIFEHAYDFISFENCPVMYGEEGITVVYPPYEMGCYASGYVIIFISYDDLGITAFSVD